MCWEIVRWVRKQGIQCTGRGSAAWIVCGLLFDFDRCRCGFSESAVCAVLDLGKLPDIDMDFPSENRDDVFRCISSRSMARSMWEWSAPSIPTGPRSRDIGKVLSIPQDALEWLSDNLSGFIRADQVDEAFGRYAELKPYEGMKDRFKFLFEMRQDRRIPRHIGTHSSGIVISRTPLAQIAPFSPPRAESPRYGSWIRTMRNPSARLSSTSSPANALCDSGS